VTVLAGALAMGGRESDGGAWWLIGKWSGIEVAALGWSCGCEWLVGSCWEDGLWRLILMLLRCARRCACWVSCDFVLSVGLLHGQQI
jgi:hypothetical protein